jgi:hypothetical protein
MKKGRGDQSNLKPLEIDQVIEVYAAQSSNKFCLLRGNHQATAAVAKAGLLVDNFCVIRGRDPQHPYDSNFSRQKAREFATIVMGNITVYIRVDENRGVPKVGGIAECFIEKSLSVDLLNQCVIGNIAVAASKEKAESVVNNLELLHTAWAGVEKIACGSYPSDSEHVFVTISSCTGDESKMVTLLDAVERDFAKSAAPLEKIT